MFTKVSLSILLLHIVFTQGQPDENPECRPPHPPGTESECCNIPTLFSSETNFHDMKHKCHEDLGIKKPEKPEPGQPRPPPPDRSVHECVDDCVFKGLNFVGSDGEFNVDAIKAIVAEIYTGEWAEVGAAAVENCLASTKNEVNSANCKNGPTNLIKCFMRATFMECPATQWNHNDVCAAAKERLTRCPNAMPPPPKKRH